MSKMYFLDLCNLKKNFMTCSFSLIFVKCKYWRCHFVETSPHPVLKDKFQPQYLNIHIFFFPKKSQHFVILQKNEENNFIKPKKKIK